MSTIETKINNHSARIFLPANKPEEVLITIHGFAGDKESSVIVAVANELSKCNIATISYDLPNHGNDTTNTPLVLEDCVQSVEDVLNYARENFE